MTFSYKKMLTQPGNLVVLRPVVPVEVFGKKHNWTGTALIDTGADRSLFDMEVAKDLQLDLSKAKKENFGGIGKDKILVHTVNVEIKLVGMNKKVTIPIGFMENSNVKAILGQEGFFDVFKITFDRKKDLINISPN